MPSPKLPEPPCFLSPTPLHPFHNRDHLALSAPLHPPHRRYAPRPTPTSPLHCRRRRRRRRVTLSETPPAAPSTSSTNTTLATALQQISSFTGTRAESRALTQRLIDSLVTMPSRLDPSATSDTPTRLFRALRGASLVRAFSSARAPPVGSVAQKSVSAARLAAQAGLPLSALSPRRSTVLAWQVAGVAAVAAVVQLTRALGVEQLARPALIAFGAVFAADQLALRGAVFEGLYRVLFPRYAEKVLKHEAGHFLAAYLHGLVVQGYVLSAAEAVRAGIPGQAGTLFADDEMYAELNNGRLTNRAIDRYSIVSMAGIAAEAINYGEAEGGESDVAALLTLLTTLQPPWTEQSVRSQARWAVLEAILLLRRNEGAFEALCDAMRERKSLGECILCIEENFVESEGAVESETAQAGAASEGGDTALQEREQAIVAELARIQKKVSQLEEE